MELPAAAGGCGVVAPVTEISWNVTRGWWLAGTGAGGGFDAEDEQAPWIEQFQRLK